MFGNLFGRRKVPLEVPHVSEVLLTQEAVESPDASAVVQINVTIVNHFLSTFHYLVPELAPEAIQSYSVDFYMAQVLNGGHGQFAHNAQGMPNTWTFARSGLLAMGAIEHLRAFDRFQAIMDRNDARARDLIKRGGFGKTDPEVEEIDAVFFEAQNKGSLALRNAEWLRTRANARILPALEMQAWIDAFAEHPAVQARMAQQ